MDMSKRYHIFLLVIFILTLLLSIASLFTLKIQLEDSKKLDEIQTTLNNWTLE